MTTSWTVSGSSTTSSSTSYTYTIPFNYVQYPITYGRVDNRKEREEKPLPSFGDEFIDEMIGGAANG